MITAEILLKQPHLPPRQTYWYAQQTTEKALKAVLIFLQIVFPRTDDLNILWNLVPHSWQLKAFHSDPPDLFADLTDPAEVDVDSDTLVTLLRDIDISTLDIIMI